MWALYLLTGSLLTVSVMAQSKPNRVKPHDEYLGIIGAKRQDECVKHLATDFLSKRAIAEIFKGISSYNTSSISCNRPVSGFCHLSHDAALSVHFKCRSNVVPRNQAKRTRPGDTNSLKKRKQSNCEACFEVSLYLTRAQCSLTVVQVGEKG